MTPFLYFEDAIRTAGNTEIDTNYPQPFNLIVTLTRVSLVNRLRDITITRTVVSTIIIAQMFLNLILNV